MIEDRWRCVGSFQPLPRLPATSYAATTFALPGPLFDTAPRHCVGDAPATHPAVRTPALWWCILDVRGRRPCLPKRGLQKLAVLL
jgi:hypothetical protein